MPTPKIDASMAKLRREGAAAADDDDDKAGSFIGNEVEEEEQSEECLTPLFPESSNDYYGLCHRPPWAMVM